MTFPNPFPHETFPNDDHNPSAGLEAVLFGCARRIAVGVLTIATCVFFCQGEMLLLHLVVDVNSSLITFDCRKQLYKSSTGVLGGEFMARLMP